MLILHTADWHLGDVLTRLDRTDDLRKRVREVAALCESRQVDLVVIAGDVFSDHSAVTYEKMTAELEHIHEAFAAFFARGGTILAITGNHDKDIRSDLIRAGMKLAAAPTRGALNPGRMYLQNGPGITTYAARGETVQFVLVPYPFAHRYAEPDDKFDSREELNRAIKTRVAAWLTNAAAKPNFDPKLPSVLVAHLNVSGSETHQLYKLTERDDVCFDGGAIPTHWAYVALGHIHKPQPLGGVGHVRYPGPLDRLRIDERNDDRGVLLVDIGPQGCRGEPEWVPLAPTPMHDIVITDPAEVAGFAAKYPDHREAIVNISVRHDSTAAQKDALTRELRKLFPRYAEIRWETDPAAAGSRGEAVQTQVDYRETVRKHLADKLTGDPDGPAIIALVETFLTEAS